MRTLIAVSWLSFAASAFGQGPTLTVQDARGNSMPLQIAELSIEVQFVADVAETTITIGFRNDSDKLLEGEFAMPLPMGATVSRYALEVKGEMRESVSVEKRRARYAYESIQRRMIDPGYVERQKGNVYRTKIFPILQNSVKRVRLGYVMPLPITKEGVRYELPLGEAGKIAEVKVKLEHLGGGQLAVVEQAGLPFAAEARVVFDSKWRDLSPQGILVVKGPAPDLDEILVEHQKDGPSLLYARLEVDPKPATPRPKAGKVRLIWDVSQSGAYRNHDREFAFLTEWFREMGEVEVSLSLLRHKVSDHGTFKVAQGDWTKLRKVLQAVTYDGATRFDLLQLDRVKEDLIFIFTDGVSPFAPAARAARPLVVVDAAKSEASTAFRSMAWDSRGDYLDLLTLRPGEAISQLAKVAPRLVADSAIEGPLLDYEGGGRRGGVIRLQGRLPATTGAELEIDGKKYPWRKMATEVKSGLVRRLWAQRKLIELERSHPHSKEDIIAHGKEFNLVSDYTSLIVLERFEDYVRYNIPPPEPELRKEWLARTEPAKPSWDRFEQAWSAKGEWHDKEFEWMEESLTPRLTQVSIWLKSVNQVFRPEQIDQDAVAVFAKWRQQTLSVIDRRAEWEQKGRIEGWRKAVAQLIYEGAKLRETPIAPPKEGEPTVVSVRGWVIQPGTVSGDQELTLSKALAKAGGLATLGSPTAVELYRNGGKVIYNMLSSRYVDVPLKRGDMVVVRDYNPEIAGRWYEGDWDVGPVPGNPQTYPAVFDYHDLWVTLDREEYNDGGADSDPFGGDDTSLAAEVRVKEGGLVTDGQLQGEIRVTAPKQKVNSLRYAEFVTAVSNGGDSPTAYRKLVSEGSLPTSTYLEVARYLMAKNQAELAEQVLSNLMETEVFYLERIRSCILWLSEFGRTESARALLDDLMVLIPGAPLSDWEAAYLSGKEGDQAAVSELLSKIISAAPGANPTKAEIALTERNGLLARKQIPAAKAKLEVDGQWQEQLARNLDADMRVVVTSSHPEFRFGLSVRDPSGTICQDFSVAGGRLKIAPGMSEYMLRRALPGTYSVKCSSSVPMTVRVVFYQDWGRENETRKEVTVWLPGTREAIDLAEYEFQFQK